MSGSREILTQVCMGQLKDIKIKGLLQACAQYYEKAYSQISHCSSFEKKNIADMLPSVAL